MPISAEALANYRQLVAKVDELCRHVTDAFRAHIACRPGCSACCRHFSLFPVEGVALATALSELPPEEAARIRERAAFAPAGNSCPLLDDGLCLLYAARPLICRTHGLPIVTFEDETRRVDFCPENFQGVDSLPGSAVIDLDRLNASLTAVNALFVATNHPPCRDRLTLAEALLLEP